MNNPLSKVPSLYNIPAGVSFADTLAKGLLDEVKDQREKLAGYLILLPTRRACRTLREAFLRQTDGAPLLLPRLQTFGDVDSEELFISGQGEHDLDMPPAMSSLKRQILLAQAIGRIPKFSKGAEQDMALAKALGSLMDQIHTENLSLSDLPHIVDRETFAEHWQVTVTFLEILSDKWPDILAEQGLIDAADRRNRLINALNHYWQEHPPAYPVIAAGSTGSIPATAALLKTIAHLPKGAVILPALDQNMSKEAWAEIEEGHPQATLKQLIGFLGCTREDVKDWPLMNGYTAQAQAREKLISQVMTPPEKTDDWQKSHLSESDKKNLLQTLEDIKRYDCATPQEEAQLIAVIMREMLEDKHKTAALITPDRHLARRVAMACRRWNIEVDDSAGYPLAYSSIGSFLRCSAQAAIENARPLSLLALLKHDKTQGAGFKNFRSSVRQLERNLLRGTKPAAGFDGIRERFRQLTDDPEVKRKPSGDNLKLIDHLEAIMAPAIKKFSGGFHDFSSLLEEHIKLMENLSGRELLWQGEDGKRWPHCFPN